MATPSALGFRHRVALIAVACGTLTLALAGCGSGSGEEAATRAAVAPSTRTAPPAATPTPTAPGPASPTPAAPRPALGDVPRSGRGDADPVRRRVAERWFAEVRAGRPARAAALMADGTRFANGDAVVLRDRTAREAAAGSLPCGAVPVRASAARGGYVVLELRLTTLAGGAPCGSEGAPVAVAVHVDLRGDAAQIDDWVRLEVADAEPVPNDASA